jgi:hypothetical protein
MAQRMHGVEAQLAEFMRRGRRAQQAVNEQTCPGHVASKDNPKICWRCGVHIDSLRPNEE